MNSKISVIIPFYNHGKYIFEAIESVYRQTFKEFEIILVNDGSTDKDTVEVLSMIHDKFPDVKIINQENGHLSNARNNGIKMSKGEYYLPLDSDDTLQPEMLQKCYDYILKNPNLGFVYTYVNFFGDFKLTWKNQEYNFYDLLFFNHPTVCGLIRRKAWEEVGGYDENMKDGYEDWEFWINLGKHGWFGNVIKTPLFNYRKHGASMSTDAKNKHDKILSYIKSKHADLYDEEKIKEIKKIWKPLFKSVYQRFKREFTMLGLKLELAGLRDGEMWISHPVKMIFRLMPIRIKKRINIIFGKEILDIKYYNSQI